MTLGGWGLTVRGAALGAEAADLEEGAILTWDAETILGAGGAGFATTDDAARVAVDCAAFEEGFGACP